jgi:peptide subunit release factor 1 (eRF1)
MAQTSPATDTPLAVELAKLAEFEPHGLPVISLYLSLAADQHGRDNYDVFLRKVLTARVDAYPAGSAGRSSLERDIARIREYLEDEVHRRANALALFACAGAGEFFEAIQLDAPLDEHLLVIGAVPHIYPLVRLVDQYPRYASVLVDTHRARILVFGLGAVERREQVTGVKTRRSSMGGWSQARYQRRAENFHLHHVKEVVATLDRVVAEDNIQHVIVAGDDSVVAILRDELPKHLAAKLVDVLALDREADDDAVIEATLSALRQRDGETDAERVAQLVDAWQAGGLGVMGPEATLRALEMGQVDELLIAARPEEVKAVQRLPDDAAPEPVVIETSGSGEVPEARLHFSDELVTRAHQTGATVRIIEAPELLDAHGGVGAFLRFRI